MPYPIAPKPNAGNIVVMNHGLLDKCKIKLAGNDYLYNLKKSDVEYKLSRKTLDEYPKTKWMARFGFAIAILLSLKELYMWLSKWMFLLLGI